jgi:uncharacterized repeat protein (TIGR04138 family)
MATRNFQEIVQLIARDDPRYAPGAYLFVREALAKTQAEHKKREKLANQRHISGTELCEGIRQYALEQYGPMAHTLLQQWGLHKTSDFGNIVFNLIEYGVLGKTPEDSIEDFNDVFDFDNAFRNPFVPSANRSAAPSDSLSKSS